MKLKKHSLKSFLILAVSLIYLQPCFSQTSKSQKWEVGADLLSLFDKNQLPDYSLFSTRKIGEKGFSLRSRLGFDMDFYKPKLKNSNQIDEVQNYNYLVVLGIERDFANFQVGNGMSLYWAADVGFNQLLTRKHQTKFISPENYIFDYSDYRSNNYHLNGSFGIIQSITERLSLRLESSISYHLEDNIGIDYYLPIEPNQPLPPKKQLIEDAKKSNATGRYRYSNNYLSLIPFNQLLLTIKF
ncbi:hypothetical protein LZF95_08635 [Algoriphagus sp. AGSA1]|uniref:hypothetical protein n=1 Tax=Algoriphagus sp. AGSA1 TaxID=2907213 RepID=UPI001F17B189|nr:hypothetical protein [Algoriphagus sp. AGSA1]MCE7054737.1 hypothetical protein [Algoriphagus sp. AGSA1]